MKLKDDLFPYPVLNKHLDDYIINNTFESEVEVKNTKLSLDINVKFSLEDKELLELLEKGIAQFAVHIEGVASSFRKLYLLKKNEKQINISIKVEDISEKLELNTMIVASEDIRDYRNTNFNKDYYGNGYKVNLLTKGDILAFDVMKEINIDFENMEKPNTKSMVRVSSMDTEFMSVDMDGDYIMIYLPKSSYESYHLLSNSSEKFKNILIIAIILPAMTYVLERLYEENIHEEKRWFIALTDLLEKNNINQDEVKENPMIVAQKLLNKPIEKALIDFKGDEFDGVN